MLSRFNMLCCFLLLLFSQKLSAACSGHVGSATLNEIMKEDGNNGDAFIEIKLLDASIPSTTYDQWTIRICHDAQVLCDEISVADMDDSTQWLWVGNPIVKRSFIDFKDGFDMALLDKNNQFIDYIQIGGYSGQNFTNSCGYGGLDYVFPVPHDITNGTKILLRKPDGTGKWPESKNLNEYRATPGSNNDGNNTTTLDHFEINHDGQGLTCEAEQITIKACADASCSTLYTDEIVVKLSINATVDQTVTITDGSASTNFVYTTAETATLSLDQTYECKDGASTSCNVVFADTGFRFFSNTEGIVIPTQLSGKPSNIGFNASNLIIQAIKKSPDTGACQAAFIDATAIDMAATCVEPIACAGSKVAISYLDTTTDIPTLDNGSLLTYSPVALNFGDNPVSSAGFVFNYPDAGKVQLHARYNIPDKDGNPSGNYMLGSSNPFVVRPFGFKLDFSQDGNGANAFAENALLAPDASKSVFKKAGEAFTLTATAMQWLSNQDDDGNGVPDDFTILNNSNLVAGNFADETLIVTANLLAPSGGNNPALEPPNPINSFANSLVSNNYKYHEVGIIELSANLNGDYLLSGDNIQGRITNVGRFIPNHFELTDSAVDDACNNFTYMDEPKLKFTYLVTAKNSQGDTTVNYIPDSEPSKNFVHSVVTLVAENNNDGIDLSARLIDFQGAWATGIYSNEKETVLDEDLGKFTRGSDVDGPYDNLFLGIKLTDNDGSLLLDLDMNAVIKDTDCEIENNCTAKKLSPTESKVRFGRWFIENTFGPETSDLPVPMAIQYYDGNNFVTNTLDSCTAFDAINLTIEDINLNPGTTSASGSGSFISGTTRRVILSAPGTPYQGAVPVSYTIQSMPWFLYDWNGEGNFDQNPTAVATFGLFRGNDRIIYQREVNN